MSITELLSDVSDHGVELWVEGSRLRFRAPRGALTSEQRAALVSRRDDVVRALRARAASSVRLHPLSYNQRALWFIAQEAPESAAYHVVYSTRILSPVEPSTIREALQALTDRHAMLRTTYVLAEDGQPMQRTVGAIDVAFEAHAVPDADDETLLKRVEADSRRPFDLEHGPVFRGSLYTRAADDQVLLLVMPHIAADGISVRILVEELWALLAEASGVSAQLPPRAEKEYEDFVEWQSRFLESAEGERQGAYWERRLQGPRAQIEVPADRQRPHRKSYRGAAASTRVTDPLLSALRRVAREEGTTLYVVLLASFETMLFRLTGTGDVVVGTPTAGRSQSEFSRVVGHFVNTVPLRTALREGMSFRELLGQLRPVVYEALDAQDFPMAKMVQRIQAARDGSRSPLFESFFSLLGADVLPSHTLPDADGVMLAFGRLRHASYPVRFLESQFDLALQVVEHDTSLEVELRYSTDLFDASTVERFLSHYVSLLEGVAVKVDTALEALPPVAGHDGSGPTKGDESIQLLLTELAARDIRVTLDGEKLRVNAPAGALDDTLKARLAKHKSDLIVALRAAAAPTAALRSVPRVAPLPISFAQQRLWFLDRMQPGNAHYNISFALRLRGTLDQRAFVRALDSVTQRHESLRIRIRDEDGNPRAELMPEVTTAVQLLDLSDGPRDEADVEARRLGAEFGMAPFDLARGPMARYLLVRVAADEHLLMLVMHHIASDGWSVSVAAREICAVYDAEVAGRPSPLPPLSVQYVDFAAWQREQMSSGLFVRQLGFWQRELAGAPAVLDLPTDRPRPPVQSYRGWRIGRRMSGEQLDALKAFSRANDATLYMTMLAAWQVLLHRHSGQDDIVVGSPLANRDRPELEGLVGCFVNNVVMRGRLEGNPTFRDYVRQVKSTVLGAFDHREMPFDRLVEALRPQRSTSHSPIFQVLFTLHSFPMQPMRPTGIEVELVEKLVESGVGTSRFDLTIEMDEHEGGLRMAYEYAIDLFDESTIDRLHAQYLTLLRQIVLNADQPVGHIPLLSEQDEQHLLSSVNATDVDHDRTRCVHQLVQEVVARTPQAIAVEAEDATLTYAELDRAANRLAHQLRARGVTSGALVGVCLDRTSSLPVALLAVHKAGAAYVPVDPTHPAERLAYTLSDARVSCIVTESRFTSSVSAVEVPLVLLDADAAEIAAQPRHAPEVPSSPSDLAYVIYTSGSTGRPKGVEIEQRNVVNFLRGMQREPGISANDVLLAVTTPSFDIAGLEIFLPLVTGARTVIASRGEVLDGDRLSERADACGATILQATPATWRMLIDAGWQGKADLTALCGGEALPRDLARELIPRVRALWNMYGPTETTIWSTLHRVTETDRDISIGHPIMNTTVYVLDATGRPAPIGVAGELCIGGEGVARGYRERPELTSEKFVTIAMAGRGPERVYRTGDVVRLRGDLTLEFVGRRDHQVKVRGYRIELGEIESVLVENAAVRRSVVIVREDAPGDQRLVAYVVPSGTEAPPTETLRAQLRARLPEYMVPSAIVVLPELPLTPNGKIDRKALPAPATSRSAQASVPVANMTDAQRRVAAIWCAVLNTERVGLHENFFDIGGHSLLVVKVHAALRREFSADVTIVDLFQRTTVAAQADLVSSTANRDVGLKRAEARLARQALA